MIATAETVLEYLNEDERICLPLYFCNIATVGTAEAPVGQYAQIGSPGDGLLTDRARVARQRSFTIDTLYRAACIYVHTTLDICNHDKLRMGPWSRPPQP